MSYNRISQRCVSVCLRPAKTSLMTSSPSGKLTKSRFLPQSSHNRVHILAQECSSPKNSLSKASLHIHDARYRSYCSTHSNSPPTDRCSNCSNPLPSVNDFKNLTIQERCRCQKCCRYFDEEKMRSVDYFSLFGFDPREYEIDPKVLKQRYHQWQQIVHPDLINRHSDKTGRRGKEDLQQKRYQENLSTLINRAYQTIRDDLKRAEYMVELDGRIRLSDETDSIEDPEFLMGVMEQREMLEGAEDFDEVENIKNSNRESIKEIVGQINKKFKDISKVSQNYSKSSTTSITNNTTMKKEEKGREDVRFEGESISEKKNLESIKDLIIKLRYYKNFAKLCQEKVL